MTTGPLSRERILTAAVEVADAEGVAAVTMRRVADRLGCEAMSLYHHVPGKEALVDGMVEVVVAEIAGAHLAVADEAEWRAVVRRRCLAARQVMLAHPWAPAVVATRTQAPAPSFLLYEALMGTVFRAGFDVELAHRTIHTLGSLVLGFTNELFDPAPGDEPDAEEEAEAMAAATAAMPNLARLAEGVVHERDGALSVCDTQAEFAFTLDVVLDGLESRRASAAGRRRRHPPG